MSICIDRSCFLKKEEDFITIFSFLGEKAIALKFTEVRTIAFFIMKYSYK